MIKKLDCLEKQVQRIRAYEIKKGDATRAWEKIQDLFDKAYTKKEINSAFLGGQELLDSIRLAEPQESKKIRIEELLGNLGAEVERAQYLSQWVAYNALPGFMNKTHEKEILEKGERYLPIKIGGHAKQTLGHIIDYSERGFDGVVHLMPFGCLPELVSQSIIPKITEELGIPVLTLSIDEQTGVANNLTRVEAFIDLIKGKRIKKIS
jgi:predicted nucleotide-binding protein (sugar kinase/HSP70/actin superfamily)